MKTHELQKPEAADGHYCKPRMEKSRSSTGNTSEERVPAPSRPETWSVVDAVLPSRAAVNGVTLQRGCLVAEQRARREAAERKIAVRELGAEWL